VERLISKILPLPYQLDPLFGSYYSNATGLFRGNVRFYNLSSIPYSTDVTWRPVADRVMENADLDAIRGRLGSWNWGAADTIRIEVHDRATFVANVSESLAIFQVLDSLSYSVRSVSKIAPRANSGCSTQRFQVPGSWNLTEYTSRRAAPSTRLLRGKSTSQCGSSGFFFFLPTLRSSPIDMRHIPSVVPARAQNATALVLEDEMTRRLTKLRTMADKGVALEELSNPRGSTLPVVACVLAKVMLETERGSTCALSLSTGSLLRLVSRRG